MRYEIKHYITDCAEFAYDTLVCFERDGLVKSMAYVPNGYGAHIVVEAMCNGKMAMAYMVDSTGHMYSVTLVHVCEIVDKHTVLRRLAEQICEDSAYWHSWQLTCEFDDMINFINAIIG